MPHPDGKRYCRLCGRIGRYQPAHVDTEYADHTLFHGVIAHGMGARH
jgi:acyl dehydratase